MSNLVLNLKDPITNEIKTVKTGFSWTVLFFGFLVPYFRQDWKNAILFTILYFLTFGLATIPFAFIYNKKYIQRLFEKGYNLLYFTGDMKAEQLQDFIVCPPIQRRMEAENLMEEKAA